MTAKQALKKATKILGDTAWVEDRRKGKKVKNNPLSQQCLIGIKGSLFKEVLSYAPTFEKALMKLNDGS